MTEFFHGWRRKLGSVALLLAIALMGLWVRSQFYEDDIRFRLGDRILPCVHTYQQSLALCWIVEPIGGPQWEWRNGIGAQEVAIGPGKSFEWSSDPITDDNGYPIGRGYWFVEWGDHFRVGEQTSRWKITTYQIVMPHWLGVFTSTLIAAWLILPKPQTRQGIKTEGHQRNDGSPTTALSSG